MDIRFNKNFVFKIIGIGAGWGMDTKILLQRFLVGMRDHFGDAERGTSMYKVFLNALVAIWWNAFAGDILSSRGMQLKYIRRNIMRIP